MYGNEIGTKENKGISAHTYIHFRFSLSSVCLFSAGSSVVIVAISAGAFFDDYGLGKM